MYHFSSGNYQSAVTDYTAAIELVTPGWRPFLHNYYAHRAEALMAAGNFEAAVADLTTAIAAYPHPAYLRLRGEAMRGLGREREVREGKEPLGWYFEPLPEVR
jgi:tetratricopeptide (TPR) repeat protein